MSEKLDRFVGLLKEIFELDKSDLDFGIYRIINLRKARIEDFLEKRLPEEVRNILSAFGRSDSEKLSARINEIEEQLGDSLATLPDVYTLDNSECVELMIEKILKQPDITA